MSHRSNPADPVVSPANTIRAALTTDLMQRYRVDERTLGVVPGSVEDVPRRGIDREALAALAALLAVGERDRQQIARLTEAVEEACAWAEREDIARNPRAAENSDRILAARWRAVLAGEEDADNG